MISTLKISLNCFDTCVFSYLGLEHQKNFKIILPGKRRSICTELLDKLFAMYVAFIGTLMGQNWQWVPFVVLYIHMLIFLWDCRLHFQYQCVTGRFHIFRRYFKNVSPFCTLLRSRDKLIMPAKSESNGGKYFLEKVWKLDPIHSSF